MKNWRRDDWFDDTGLAVGEPVAEHAQPGRGDALSRASARSKARNLSVGRGTDTPFEQIGAPWIDGRALAAALNARSAAGRALLSGALHAGVEQARRPGVPGRLLRRDRSRSRCGRSGRPRDRRGSRSPVRRALRPREDSVVAGVETSRSLRCVRAVIRPRSPPSGRATRPAGACCGRSTCSTDGRHGAARRQGPSQLQEPPAYAGRLRTSKEVDPKSPRSRDAGGAAPGARAISRAEALQPAGLVRLDPVVREEPPRSAAQVQLLLPLRPIVGSTR